MLWGSCKLSDKINKFLATPVRKNKKSYDSSKRFEKVPQAIRKKIMTSPQRRLEYFQDFYESSDYALIEKIVLVKTDDIHQQLINNMRSLVNLDLIVLSLKKQIAFNVRVEQAFQSINIATKKNVYLRNFSKSTTANPDLRMYFQRQGTISDADKAKIRAHILNLKKQELLAKSMGTLEPKMKLKKKKKSEEVEEEQ